MAGGFLGLLVRIGGDSTGFKRAISESEKFASSAFKRIASTAGAVIGLRALSTGIGEAIQKGSRISDLATRFGITARELQNLEFAALKAGSQIEELVTSFTRLARSRGEALIGSEAGKEYQAIFEALGVDVGNLSGMSIVEIFKQIGETVRKSGVGDELEFELAKILGQRSAGNIITLFKEGLDQWLAVAEKIGIAMDDATVQKLDEAADLIAEIKQRLREPFGIVAVTFLKGMTEVIKQLRMVGAMFQSIFNLWYAVSSGRLNLADIVREFEPGANIFGGLLKATGQGFGGAGKVLLGNTSGFADIAAAEAKHAGLINREAGLIVSDAMFGKRSKIIGEIFQPLIAVARENRSFRLGGTIPPNLGQDDPAFAKEFKEVVLPALKEKLRKDTEATGDKFFGGLGSRAGAGLRLGTGSDPFFQIEQQQLNELRQIKIMIRDANNAVRQAEDAGDALHQVNKIFF